LKGITLSLTVGTNSWVTLSEANTYLADKFNADAWSSLSDSTKEKTLISAFWWIFNYPGVSIPKTSTAEKVKNAQIELAWWMYNYGLEYEKREALIAGGVTEFRLSKWMEKLSEQDLPKRILNILDDELVNLGGYFPTFDRDLEN
jgi:hypothetical protein